MATDEDGSSVLQPAEIRSSQEAPIDMPEAPSEGLRVTGAQQVDQACGSSSSLHSTVDFPKLDAEILTEVRNLNHYPKRRKIATNFAEKQEDSLAQRISKRWSEFLPSTRTELEAMQRRDELPILDAEILTALRNFDHYPKRKKML